MFWLAVCCLLSPSVPGATKIEPVNDVIVRNGMLEGARQPLSVISDDGAALFVNEGKIARYTLGGRYTRMGAEDVFYGVASGRPISLTTSQGAHAKRGPDYERVSYQTRSLVCAPSAVQILLGARMPTGLRLSIVNINRRGNHPNDDVEIAAKGRENVKLLGAKQLGDSIHWYVDRTFSNKRGRIDRIVISNGKHSTVDHWYCAPYDWDYFDPSSGILIGNVADEKLGSAVLIGRRDDYAAIKTAYPERTGLGGYKHAFLSRGKVLAQTERLYVRDADRKWKPFGSEFIVLAKSANDRYWLILDEVQQAWKVTF